MVTIFCVFLFRMIGELLHIQKRDVMEILHCCLMEKWRLFMFTRDGVVEGQRMYLITSLEQHSENVI